MKVDDDILINTRLLYNILRYNTSPNFTLGTIHWAKPIRSPRGPNGKFYTPVSVYPGERYPPYFNGHAYVLSTDVAVRVYHTAKKTVILPWSDVFVGVCLRKLGIRLRHSQLFLATRFKMANKTTFTEDNNAVDIMRGISLRISFLDGIHEPDLECMDRVNYDELFIVSCMLKKI